MNNTQIMLGNSRHCEFESERYAYASEEGQLL